MTDAPTAIDLFSGAGGFSLGLEQAGFATSLGLDSDERAMAAYRMNFPSASALVGDTAGFVGEQLLDRSGWPGCDLVAGGPPCQAFSVAGQRRWADARKLLPLEFARLTAEIGARYFVMENVPGLLLPQFAGLRHAFRDQMHRAGYNIAEPWLLDATDFGVPQHRRRVFVVGAKRNLPLPEMPEPIGAPPPTARDAIGDLETLDLGTQQLGTPPSTYARWLRGESADPSDRSPQRRAQGSLTGCSRVTHSPAVTARFAATAPGSREPISRFGRLHPARPACAIRAGTASSNGGHTAARPIHYRFPRCITVREAARLQSLPDWFAIDRTVWRGHMQVGNAVPPLLARAVGHEIRRVLCRA